jgi:hypothetical protein
VVLHPGEYGIRHGDGGLHPDEYNLVVPLDPEAGSAAGRWR